VVLLNLFFIRGGFGIDCLTEDLVASAEDGISLYHRTRKGQRGVSVARKLLCHLPPTVHTEVIQMLYFFDSIRHTLSGEKYPIARWAIDASEKHDKWIGHTVTGWLHEATSRCESAPGRFQQDLALLTQGSSDSRLKRRRDATKDLILLRMVNGVMRRP
jgi:hypothetical protein